MFHRSQPKLPVPLAGPTSGPAVIDSDAQLAQGPTAKSPDLNAGSQAMPGPALGPTGVVDDDQEYREARELALSGSRARATMTSVTYGGETGDGVIWRMGMRVEPGAGDAFEAELAVRSLAYDKDFAPWEVGNTATVVFAPDDPTRVRFLPPGMESTVRWQVPSVCPKCGAPVDQSTECMAAHPTCAFCHEPLPCQPAL
jgi:hypothetical protein